MIIPLDRTSTEPLYRQIVQRFRRLIESGALTAGAKLPATRALASTLRVNRNTVNSAYEELLAQGLIVAHVGQGTFVAPPARPPEEASRPPRPRPHPPSMRMDWMSLFSKGALSAADAASPAARTVTGRRGIVSFASGALETALFPVDEFRRSIDRVLRAHGETLLGYGSADGFPALKSFLRSYLLERGIDAHEEGILITNGSQQGLDLIARSFLDPGDVVVMESPSYAGGINVFRSLRANIMTLPPLSGGFRPAHLEDLLQRQRPKMIYLVPTFHNPTGLTAGMESRKSLLDVVAGHNVVVIEDDTHERLRYEGLAVPSLKSISGSHQVIYLSAFSAVFPGLRLGWVAADRPVTERLAEIKRITDMHTSELIQAAVYDFCRRGWMERAIDRVNAERKRRRDAMLEALERYMPDGVRWTRPEGGLWLMLTLPPPLDSGALLEAAAAGGVLYIPGAFFHPNGGGQRELRLIFPQTPLPSIDKGIRRLADVITRALRGKETARWKHHASIDPMV